MKGTTVSAETLEWLNENSLIGFTAERGSAWHYLEGYDNHFEGAIPVERVESLLAVPLEAAAISATLADGRIIAMPDRQAIVRTDTGSALGVFKSGYKIHPYDEWLRQNLDLILDGGLQFGSAILLKGGAVAAVQVELPETRVATGGKGAEPVKHRPHVTAATSSDGSMATTYMRGTRIWVCDNTLAYAMREKDALKVKVRHSSQSLNRVGEIRMSLGLMVEEAGDEFDLMVRELTAQYVSDQKFAEVVKSYTGTDKNLPAGRSTSIAKNKEDALLNLWRNDERVAPWRNSAWGVLAAFNTADHHLFSQKGNVAKRAERNEVRFLSGDREQFDRNVLRLLETV
jgi:phage/plasmid-like protein (TIGR03299 family)